MCSPWLRLVTVCLLTSLASFAQEGELGLPPQLDQLDVQQKTAALSGAGQKNAGGWINTADREAVRNFYLNVLVPAASVAMGWTGSISSGNAGATSAAYKSAMQSSVNWFRSMAGVPPGITFNPVYSGKAQKAALMFSANRSLNHYPPQSWTHYDPEGAEAAGNSNICYQYSGSAFLPGCIDAYMRDEGNSNYPVGHRRWILYPQTQEMGTGDVNLTNASPLPYPYANALWVFDGRWSTPRPATRDSFVAWPPPGYVPYQTIYPRWSFSYPQADFSAATVTMRDASGAAIPLTIAPLANGFGENTIVWNPVNALPIGAPTADVPIDVAVSGVVINNQPQSFSYRVTAFNALVAGASTVRAERLGVYRGGRWILDKDGDGSFTSGLDRDFPLGFPGATPVQGDWNGDGSADVGVYANGFWFLDFNGNGVWDGSTVDRQFPFGWNGATPLVGDWNGDGRDSVGVYASGFWFLDSDGDSVWDGPSIDMQAAFGWTGATPVVGDWNGDGRDQIGIYANGFWSLDRDGNGRWDGPAVDRHAYLGWTGATPLVGDWNGDGRTAIGVYANGLWYLDADGNGVWDGPSIDVRAEFGFAGATPIVGDWNGNGRDQIGVFHQGYWYLDLNGSGSWNGSSIDRQYRFGESGDMPTTGFW